MQKPAEKPLKLRHNRAISPRAQQLTFSVLFVYMWKPNPSGPLSIVTSRRPFKTVAPPPSASPFTAIRLTRLSQGSRKIGRLCFDLTLHFQNTLRSNCLLRSLLRPVATLRSSRNDNSLCSSAPPSYKVGVSPLYQNTDIFGLMSSLPE